MNGLTPKELATLRTIRFLSRCDLEKAKAMAVAFIESAKSQKGKAKRRQSLRTIKGLHSHTK